MSSLGDRIDFYATLLTADRPASRCFRWLLAYLVIYLLVTYIVGRVAGDWPRFLVGGIGVLGVGPFAKIVASKGSNVSENTEQDK
mgnify:FL=1